MAAPSGLQLQSSLCAQLHIQKGYTTVKVRMAHVYIVIVVVVLHRSTLEHNVTRGPCGLLKVALYLL